MAACRALSLLTVVVVVLCCGQAVAQQQQQKPSWRDSPQFRRFQDALQKRSQSQAPRMQQVPATGLVPGDIVISAAVLFQGSYPDSLFVLNGSTLELKGSLQANLEPFCDYQPGGFSFTPDQTQLVVPCYKFPADAAAKGVSIPWNIVAIDTKNLTTAIVAQTTESYFYGLAATHAPSGDLLIASIQFEVDNTTGYENPVSNVVLHYNKTYVNTGVYNMSAFDYSASPLFGIHGMDLTTDASELLAAAQTKVVSEYDIPANTAGNPAFTVVGKRCSSVVALYDNSKIVGCSNAKDGFCAYHVSEQGKIVKSWCTPFVNSFSSSPPANDDAVGVVQLAMDVDRASFIMTIWNAYRDFFVDTSSPNVFRISTPDFEQMSNTTLIGNLWGGVSVFSAYPASQQDCGRGKCCTPAGKYVAAQTVCKASKDPCTSDAKCSGTSGSCPSPKKAKDGSFCSHDPFGIFDVVDKKSIPPEEAEEEGYHKCGQCSFGYCYKSGKHGKGKHGGRRELLESEYDSYDSKAEHKGRKHKGWVYCEERSEDSE